MFEQRKIEWCKARANLTGVRGKQLKWRALERQMYGRGRYREKR